MLTIQGSFGDAPLSTSSSFDLSNIASLIQSLPNVATQITNIIQKAQSYLPTISQAVDDPSLPTLMDRIRTLQALTAGQPSGTATPATPGAPSGVGLNRVIPFFDAAIWYEKHKYAPWLIGAGTLLVLGGIGFGVGRLTKHCQTSTMGWRRRRY